MNDKLKEKARIDKLEKIWYSRNPSQDGSGRFFKTVLMVFDEFAEQNTLTLESKIDEDGVVDEPNKLDFTIQTPSLLMGDIFDSRGFQYALKKYNNLPTIGQMPSIIRELREENERQRQGTSNKHEKCNSSVGAVMKRISHFDTLDGGNSFGNGIKDLKFHCTLDENFQPDKFYITWLDGEVEEVKPIYAL